MKNFRRGAVWTVVCASLLCVPALQGEEVRPTFRVDSNQLVVGPVTAGTTAVATFVFHNKGDAEVHILRAAPS